MPQRLRFAELAPEGIAALRQLEHYLNTGTTLSPVLLELLRLRVSTLNGCDFCIQMHTAELFKHNEPESRIDAVANWESSSAFTPRERAALAYADSVTNIQQTHVTDAEYAAINEFFSGKDLADLTIAIANINSCGTVSRSLSAASGTPLPPSPKRRPNPPPSTSAMPLCRR